MTNARTPPHPGAAGERPGGGEEDQQVDARVFEEVDAVGKEGDGSDRERDGELDPEVAQVEERNDEHDPPESPDLRHGSILAAPGARWAQTGARGW